MRNSLWHAGLLLALTLSVGCTSHTHGQNDPHPQAWLKPGVRVTLPPPGITPAVNSQQLLTGEFNGQKQSLLVMLNADREKITLAGLSSVGIRLFLATYDSRGIHTEQSIVVPQLPPASQVLADIMLSHWPVDAWRSHLPAGWTLTDHLDRRELRDSDGKLVTRITYLERGALRQPISIEQAVFHYHITIQYLDD
ncbi:DUF3261 domain-containing protein [Cronobacter dublinensis]|uniref:DUF3261 domain-containing protein n=1 Tax=Cronobacter dublinensis TaxID=413497 RepID=UPI000D007696|nr:DUF3261 domain-containing protein [Cronobacter dublinensis]ELY2795260.1 DUF3261 domain-containing protein [Cronobacter dublinensis]ELY3970118.1 DUF3261 domain-containing protein [Cronobacter dublinensis]ELY4485580.1 DUF3261 domain-containing protein [Cronobacter dublinensis]ELY5823031.1 DUF3261 domain-containing protein [Cronobacter dublinensis]